MKRKRGHMTRQRKLFLGFAVLVLGASVAAQQGGRSQQPAASGGQMSMADMMKGCRDHCDRTSKGMDAMASAMKAARDSKDPAAMEKAMDRMDTSMADMKEHMGMCMRMMNMMNKMQDMHGKGGVAGMMGGSKPADTPAPSAKAALDITFTSEPSPPRTGENAFEVVVKDAQGKAVTGADVIVRLYMAAMPSMNMPEMRSSAALKHAGGGRYRGTGNVAMAGRWDVTVSVSKDGKEIGSRKLAVTAR